MPLEEGDTFFFAPRPLRNLVRVDEIESLSPILSARVADLAGEDTPQLYMLCGRGPRSSLRVLRHGLEVSEMAISELPGNPTAVWTVKKRNDGEFFSRHLLDLTKKYLNHQIFRNFHKKNSDYKSATETVLRNPVPFFNFRSL